VWLEEHGWMSGDGMAEEMDTRMILWTLSRSCRHCKRTQENMWRCESQRARAICQQAHRNEVPHPAQHRDRWTGAREVSKASDLRSWTVLDACVQPTLGAIYGVSYKTTEVQVWRVSFKSCHLSPFQLLLMGSFFILLRSCGRFYRPHI
jgi:hypothetical protein